jgi:hypothetical protein
MHRRALCTISASFLLGRSDIRAMSATAQASNAESSLVRGDLPFRRQKRIAPTPDNRLGLGLVRRALFWSLLGWLPVAVWAFYMNRA